MYMFVNRSGKPIDTLKKIFSTYDVNKDGKLDPEEVKGLLKVSTTFVCIKCSKIMYSTNNPVLRLKTRSQTCGISHLNLVNWTLDMKNQ